MSKRNSLPVANFDRPASSCVTLSIKALEQWNQSIKAASDSAGNVINIYDQIGYDYWTGEGTTAKRISAALRSIGTENDVVVNINSPGGDVFEGLAIYNLFRQHKGTVTMRVLGLAASAASFIAMAGDRIEVARAGFFMIHNAWTIAAGNRNDFTEVATFLAEIDGTIADIYALRTGGDKKDLAAKMDAETWIGGVSAVEQGFADDYLEVDQIEPANNLSPQKIAAHKMDLLMARAGVPMAERKSMISALAGQADTPQNTHQPDLANQNDTDLSELLELSRQFAGA